MGWPSMVTVSVSPPATRCRTRPPLLRSSRTEMLSIPDRITRETSTQAWWSAPSLETNLETDTLTHLPVLPFMNVRFSQELADNSSFRAREVIAEKDSLTLAHDILALDQNAFSAASRKSPMQRAKLHGLQRNAGVVLDNIRDRQLSAYVPDHSSRGVVPAVLLLP